MTSEHSPEPTYPRRARALVEEALTDTPVVLIQGARQVGKSTLAAQVLADRPARFFTLDTSAVLNAARTDPDSFVRQSPGSLLAIDEIQRAPELLRAIKAVVDEDRRPGQFLLTGSTNLLANPGQHESLAGRAETVALYGVSQGEVRGGSDDLAEVLLGRDEQRLGQVRCQLTRADYLELICAGSFPEALLRQGRRRQLWLDNYLSRIVDRDARDISRLGHLDRLPRLVRLLAANNSGELVKSRIAADSGIPETSIAPYLDLLASLYLIQVIPSWGGNLTKRVVARPKVSFLDSGLAARLANVSPVALMPGSPSGHHAGPLVEAFVAGELRRQSTWSQNPFELLHFRDRNGLEVDLVIEDTARNIAAIEVKASATVETRDFSGLSFLRDKTGARFTIGAVLYTGREALRFGDRLWALPLGALWGSVDSTS